MTVQWRSHTEAATIPSQRRRGRRLLADAMGHVGRNTGSVGAGSAAMAALRYSSTPLCEVVEGV